MVHLELGLTAVDSLLRLALRHARLDRGGCQHEVVPLALAVAHLGVITREYSAWESSACF